MHFPFPMLTQDKRQQVFFVYFPKKHKKENKN